MKRIFTIGNITVALVLAALSMNLMACGKEEEKAPQKTETVRNGDFVIKINASGNLESLLSVEIKSNVEGEIEKLHIEEGDFVEKGQVLIQIDDEQIREEMKQAKANVDASKAQSEQSKLSLAVDEKRLESSLDQQRDSVIQAQASYSVAKATTKQQLSQQETTIHNTREALEQDEIALRQAKISLRQAGLTLSELEEAEKAAKVDRDNADAELKRSEGLYEKKYISKKSLEDAQASQANAYSRYETSQKRLLSQKETIQSQKETINTRERAVLVRKTTLDYEILNLGLIRQTRVAQEEQAETQLKITQTRLTQLEQNITDEVSISRFSLEGSRANLLRVQSTLKNQEERLGWTKIIAPMSGVVINLEVEEGEIVTSGRSAFSQSPALMSIVDLSQMVVKTFINEVDMEKLKLGQSVEIQVPAYPNRPFRGKVREISPSGAARDNIIYFEVMVAVLGSPKELRPGMTADVDIIVVKREGTLLLPISAVQSERAMTAGLTVPAADVAGLTSQQSVELELGAGGKIAGKISRVTPGAQRGNVVVTLKSGGRRIRPGRSSVNLIVDGNSIPNVPAMISFGKEYSVMLIPAGEVKDDAKNGEIKGIKTPIEVGEQNDTDIAILGGLKAGDQVLVQAPAQQGGQFGRRR